MEKNIVKELIDKYSGQKVKLTCLQEGTYVPFSKGPQPAYITGECVILPKDHYMYEGEFDNSGKSKCLVVQEEPQWYHQNFEFSSGKRFVPKENLVQVITPDGKVWGNKKDGIVEIEEITQPPKSLMEETFEILLHPNSFANCYVKEFEPQVA
jgi:hypothetical protein